MLIHVSELYLAYAEFTEQGSGQVTLLMLELKEVRASHIAYAMVRVGSPPRYAKAHGLTPALRDPKQRISKCILTGDLD